MILWCWLVAMFEREYTLESAREEGKRATGMLMTGGVRTGEDGREKRKSEREREEGGQLGIRACDQEDWVEKKYVCYVFLDRLSSYFVVVHNGHLAAPCSQHSPPMGALGLFPSHSRPRTGPDRGVATATGIATCAAAQCTSYFLAVLRRATGDLT